MRAHDTPASCGPQVDQTLSGEAVEQVKRLRRRLVLRSASVPMALGLAQGCSVAQPASGALASPSQTTEFVFEGGVGRRAGGPDLTRYVDSSGRFPVATPATWFQPSHFVDGFSRLGDILPASRSPRSTRARALDRASEEPALSWWTTGTQRRTVDEYLSRHPVTGLLIARDDRVLLERYQYGRDLQHRFTSFSMAKTVIAALIGIAVADGTIRSIDDPAERYAPELAGTEYGATPLRHLLTMSSGVRFREDYDGNDDVARLARNSLGGLTAGGAAAVRGFNDRIAAPGQRWAYASSETYVLALVLRRAVGMSIGRFCGERLWQPIGAESDALWLTDRSGLEVGYMGLNATLRDYARLGLMLAQGGRADGRQVLPAVWLAEMTRPHFSAQQTGRGLGYGFQTWTFPANDGSFALLGVRGQMLFVHPGRRMVLVQTSIRPASRDPATAETRLLWQAALAAS
jgi:CubicO group peptidase (beta-lactamase class C family)